MKKSLLCLVVSMVVFIAVPPPARAATNAPILVLSGYSTTPAEVSPGDQFDLSLTLKNEGQLKARNVLVTLRTGASESAGKTTEGSGGEATTKSSSSSGSQPISVLSAGNVRFLGEIATGKDKTLAYKLVSGGATEPQAYNLVFDISYVNPDTGSEQTVTQSIGLPLNRKVDLNIVDLKHPKVVKRGRRFKISGEVVNPASFAVAGISVSVGKGAVIQDGQNAFVGSLDGGESDSFEVWAKAKTTGRHTVRLIISHKDDFNATKSTVKTLPVKVGKSKGRRASKPSSDDGGFVAKSGHFVAALLGLATVEQ